MPYEAQVLSFRFNPIRQSCSLFVELEAICSFLLQFHLPTSTFSANNYLNYFPNGFIMQCVMYTKALEDAFIILKCFRLMSPILVFFTTQRVVEFWALLKTVLKIFFVWENRCLRKINLEWIERFFCEGFLKYV